METVGEHLGVDGGFGCRRRLATSLTLALYFILFLFFWVAPLQSKRRLKHETPTLMSAQRRPPHPPPPSKYWHFHRLCLKRLTIGARLQCGRASVRLFNGERACLTGRKVQIGFPIISASASSRPPTRGHIRLISSGNNGLLVFASERSRWITFRHESVAKRKKLEGGVEKKEKNHGDTMVETWSSLMIRTIWNKRTQNNIPKIKPSPPQREEI